MSSFPKAAQDSLENLLSSPSKDSTQGKVTSATDFMQLTCVCEAACITTVTTTFPTGQLNLKEAKKFSNDARFKWLDIGIELDIDLDILTVSVTSEHQTS